jgi:hypothetical protein
VLIAPNARKIIVLICILMRDIWVVVLVVQLVIVIVGVPQKFNAVIVNSDTEKKIEKARHQKNGESEQKMEGVAIVSVLNIYQEIDTKNN